MIEFKDIQVKFKPNTVMEVHALRGVSLTINEGEFVTVIGANGAGKSTLLNVLTGAVPVTSGSIKVDGIDITKWSQSKRSSVVARVFQDPMVGTCADLSIEENMALSYRRGQQRGFNLAINKIVREELKDYVSMLNMGLEDRLGDPIGMLSGGQRQTLSLLMSVLSPMKILVLDEHTAALDPKTADFVIELTEKIVKERQLTVMMVTHSMQQALHVGSRTVMFYQGNTVLDLCDKKREKMEITDLLNLFKKKSGAEVDDDNLILT